MFGGQCTAPCAHLMQRCAPWGSAHVSPRLACPLGMASRWPRFHGDTEPFPISRMLSAALGWGLQPLPCAHGRWVGMGSSAGGEPCSSHPAVRGRRRVPYPTLCVLGLCLE